MTPGEAGTPVRRILHPAVYNQKLSQYNQTSKLYEDHIDELLKQTTAELDKIIITKLQTPFKLRKFKHSEYKIPQLFPLRIQISSHNFHNCSNYFQCYTPQCSHVPFIYPIQSPFPSGPSSHALIPIRIEPITSPNLTQSPTLLNDLEILISSLKVID